MKPPVGTTFVVAATLLGLAAVVQLAAILVYFGPGFSRPVVAADPPPDAAAEPAVTPEASEPAPAAEGADEPDTQEVDARAAELLAEAERLGAGPAPGDALVPLEEAATLQPRNPEVLSRLGSLYERLGQTELAETAWENLIALGPDAGRFLDVAEIRLRVLRNEGAGERSGEETLQLRDQIGLQPGSNLGVVDLKIDEQEEGGLATKNLRLAVKARPGEPIDGRDVRINVTFYEMLNGEIVPTMSRVQSVWFTTPVDWKNEGIEILEVKYEVPRIGPDGGPAPQYYGYLINIYHRGQLQETRADPVQLQDLFPPPLSDLPAMDQSATGGTAP
jgi:tetratricopeptide (TPR) repeat protein